MASTSVGYYDDENPQVHEQWVCLYTQIRDLKASRDQVDAITAVVYDYVKNLEPDLVVGLFLLAIKYMHGVIPVIEQARDMDLIPIYASQPFDRYAFDYPESLHQDLSHLALASIDALLSQTLEIWDEPAKRLRALHIERRFINSLIVH